MKILKLSLSFVGVLSVWGCGPYISESRMGYAPARPENCDIKVVNVPAATLGPMNPDYELLGMVTVQSRSNEDPFNEELLSELRPRFCKLGGEEVSLGVSTGGASGSATIYNVLKKKGGAGNAAEAPLAPPASASAPAP